MTNQNTENWSQRLDELVAAYVLGDLSDEEQQELDSFESSEVASRIESMERTAARVLLTFEEMAPLKWEKFPTSLDARLRESVRRFQTESESPHREREIDLETSRLNSSMQTEVDKFRTKQLQSGSNRKLSGREAAGWALALAASVLALASWLPFLGRDSSASGSVVEKRSRLLKESEDLIEVSWQKPGDETSLGRWGDVVWSTDRQEGYMRLVGLAENDPTKEQYQLWIIDPLRDTKPVDGGVFDIRESGEVIVPIVAKLRVDQPTAFAITIEKPGGVVVSDQSRLPLLAKVAH